MFDGKKVLVSGGTSGIGLAVARAFAGAGATVVAPQVSELDVTVQADVDRAFRDIEDLDVLVNCAGTLRRDEEFTMETFQHVMEVNLNGTMRLCVGAKTALAKRKGCIVNIASMLSYFGGPRVPAYTASKGAVAQLTKSLAAAWAGDGIRVNAVAPGWIRTPLTQALQDDAVRSAPILARTPMARWGEPEDIAGPVLFLCSEAARFITGAILPVDGGYSAA